MRITLLWDGMWLICNRAFLFADRGAALLHFFIGFSWLLVLFEFLKCINKSGLLHRLMTSIVLPTCYSSSDVLFINKITIA